VVWGIDAVAFANDDALDTAFGTQVTVTDTGGTTGDNYATAETSAITIGGTPEAGDLAVIRIARVATNGSDTLAIDAKLLAVEIFYTVSEGDLTGTDATTLQLTAKAGNDFTAGKIFAYDQTAAYADPRKDIGLFKGSFRQTTAQTKAILKYVLSTARASTIAFPTLGGVTYPFGVIRGALPKNAKIIDFSVSRHNLVFWDIELTFAEEA